MTSRRSRSTARVDVGGGKPEVQRRAGERRHRVRADPAARASTRATPRVTRCRTSAACSARSTWPNVDVDTFLDISPIVSNNVELGVETKARPGERQRHVLLVDEHQGPAAGRSTRGVYEVQRQRVEIQGLELNVSVRDADRRARAVDRGYAHLLGRTDSNGDGQVDIDLDGANISPDRLNVAARYVVGGWSALVQTQKYFSRGFQRRPIRATRSAATRSRTRRCASTRSGSAPSR